VSRKLRTYVRNHHLSLLCLFLIVSGGTAYATHPGGANTISSDDIINGQVRTADIGANQVRAPDLSDASVTSAQILDNSVSGTDIANASVGFDDLSANSVTSTEVVNGSLRGVDVGTQFVTFSAAMPAVSANTCNTGLITGLPTDARDHLVLTESADSTRPWIINLPVYRTVAGTMFIRRCNIANFDEAAGNHTFNLLVINAQ
jgi:hypothetical protein